MAKIQEQRDSYVVASDIPANNDLPGENGYRGASSLLPGQRAPRSEFAPKPQAPINSQTRTVSSQPVAPGTHGMNARKSDGMVPPNGRPVTRR